MVLSLKIKAVKGASGGMMHIVPDCPCRIHGGCLLVNMTDGQNQYPDINNNIFTECYT